MICELTNELKNKGFVSAQLAVDGDATLINHLLFNCLQKTGVRNEI